MRRYAFTLIELIFVIVIMGLLSKFGIEFLARAYDSFIASSINNSLQSKSAMAVETIAARLQYRIKDSIIARQTDGTFEALSSSNLLENATILEWIGYDVDGQRGDGTQTTPLWSGIIDLKLSTATVLNLPQTDNTKINTLIDALSGGGSNFNSSAIYFIGSDSNIDGYGWGGAINDQSKTMHPITNSAGVNIFNFTGVDVYEYYQLAWSAYAISHEGTDLWLYYDYQPWHGETYSDGKRVLLMQNVDTFRFKGIGSIVKIQVCVNQNILAGREYSLCKEKTIF